jgi:uncharacterized protein
MPDTRRISAETARRFLALHHLLAPPRSLPPEPASVMAVIERLGSIQFDPLGIAGRNHDLVLHARIEGYRPEWTEQLLYGERALFETYNKMLSLLPTAELPWHRYSWDRIRRRHERETFPTHADAVRTIAETIRLHGPKSALDFEHGGDIEWYWRPTNRTRALLEALWESGILGIERRVANRRYYDLVERLYPASLLEVHPPEREQLRHRLLSIYRAHGLAGTGGDPSMWYGVRQSDESGKPIGAPLRAALLAELVTDGALTRVEVDGIRGPRHVVTSELAVLDQAEAEIARGALPGDAAPGVAFLAPLDSLVWDRALLRTLYGFDYIWEVYVPEPKRKWGYYVLPLWFGDRFVGRIEPRIERKDGVVRIVGLWFERGFVPARAEGFVPAFRDALTAYAEFAGARRLEWAPALARYSRLVGRRLVGPANRTGGAVARTTPVARTISAGASRAGVR